MDQTDVVIRRLYAQAMAEAPGVFRVHALETVATELGAKACAWVTASHAGTVGEFTCIPDEPAVAPARLVACRADDGEIPEGLGPAGLAGHAVVHRHQTGELISVVGLWHAQAPDQETRARARRLVAHMAEAGALCLDQLIQRDDRLAEMGRPSRGAAALVDENGVIYAASPRFRALLTEHFGVDDATRLPFALPAETAGGDWLFSEGSLRFRVQRAGNLLLVHARAPQPLDTLSPREQQIARALVSGKTFKSVARQCGIAVSTVANHASRIYRKLGIYRREDLVEMMRRARSPAPRAPDRAARH